MKLICYTNNPTGNNTPYAVLDISQERATKLLALKCVFPVVQKSINSNGLSDRLYALELWDTDVEYSEYLGVDDKSIEIEVNSDTSWLIAPDSLEVYNSDEYSFMASGETLLVNGDGCRWTSVDEGGQFIVETDILSWNVLLDISNGKKPSNMQNLTFSYADSVEDDDEED